MSFGIADLLVLGLAIITLGALALLGLTLTDLGPASRLNGHRRLFLGLAVGSGVLSFSAKLILILGFTSATSFSGPSAAARPIEGGMVVSNMDRRGDRFHLTVLDTSVSGGIPADAALMASYTWESLPDTAPSPIDNPTTAGKVALGKKLFNDPGLSRDGSVSCASCHDLTQRGGGDGLSVAKGIDGLTGTRNSPTVWNAAFQARLFWDGRAASLEEQALGPFTNPVEMGMPNLDAVVAVVAARPDYRRAFDKAFGGGSEINSERIAQAIAAYERTLITVDTPYDRYVRGDMDALSAAQIRGMALFESLGCVSCHSGPNFSAASVFDERAPRRAFPINPTPFESEFNLIDLKTDGERNGRPVWRVPSLRNVALTGPWLHNGSVGKLEDVVRIMAAAQLGWSGHYLLWSEASSTLKTINRPLPSEDQVNDITAFLHALSSDRLVSLRRGSPD